MRIETTIENKQVLKLKAVISNSYLIRQSFKGNRRESGTAIFAWITHTVPLRISVMQ